MIAGRVFNPIFFIYLFSTDNALEKTVTNCVII